MMVKQGSCPPVLQQPASCGVGLSQEAQHPSTSPSPPPLRVARPTARRMPAVPAAVPAPQRSTRLPMGLPTPRRVLPGSPRRYGREREAGGGSQGAAPCRGKAGSSVRGDGSEPPRGPRAPRPAVRSSPRPSGKPLPPSLLGRGGCRAAERCLRRRWKPC